MRVCILENIEDIFETKSFIDDYLIKTDKVTENMELQDFILNYCNLSNKIYMYKGKVIPFELHKFGNEILIILANNKNADILLNKLKSTNYSFGSAQVMDLNNIDFLLKPANEREYFLINKKIYFNK